MSRIALGDVAPVKNTPTDPVALDVLIPNYARQKEDFDALKKEVDRNNALIKDTMLNMGLDKYEACGWVAKRTESSRETMNAEKLLEVMKKHGLTGCIQTVEVVDMTALEKYLYDNGATPELADDIDKCRNITPVVTLRVSKAKANKEDNE